MVNLLVGATLQFFVDPSANQRDPISYDMYNLAANNGLFSKPTHPF